MESVIYGTKLNKLNAVKFELSHFCANFLRKLFILENKTSVPFQISENTLAMMDKSIENFNSGKVSEAIDLSKFM